MRSIRLAQLACTLALTASAHAAIGGVHIVGPGGNQAYPTIQSAVDAAADGDVLMVGPGSYAGFTVAGKGLAIHAVQPGQVEVVGTVLLSGLPATSTLLLEGLTVEGPQTVGGPALEITSCAGFVRLERCEFIAAPGYAAGPVPGSPGAIVTLSFRVLFAASSITGGFGTGDPGNGVPGGTGLQVELGAVALYDCSLLGGRGGQGAYFGGVGGDAARAVVGGLFASGSTFQGGKGGYAYDFLPAVSGDGGNGLRVEATAQAQLVDNELAGGVGGGLFEPSGTVGDTGLPISAAAGATVVQHATAKRVYEAPPIVGDAQTLDIAVTGQPGDALALLRGLEAAYTPQVPTTGVLTLLPFAKQLYYPLGTLSGSTGILQVPVPDMGPAATARQFFAQGLVRPLGGGKQLGSPFSLLVLGRGALPDCDADGVNDYLALVEGAVADCDGNLVPDACDIANGFDCNGNGVVDACDIANGTSTDANGNGVPDECDPVNAVWYVNASAPAGGNGSPAFPFQSIGQGVAAALTGDVVLVADGTYVGPQNRNMSFGGRDIVVVSADGPSNCVVDAQGLGRAFEFINSKETKAARLEGLTIRNGNAAFGSGFTSEGGGVTAILSDVTIRECVFESNTAAGGGGALRLEGSASQVIGCVFEGNTATSAQGFGGAVLVRSTFLPGTEVPQVSNCTFDGNTAGQQGGALGFLGKGLVVTHCTFTRNQAGVYGGAVYAFAASPTIVVMSECLLAGNTAQHGGGFAGTNAVRASGCTLVHNVATGSGGGIFQKGSTSSMTLTDSIVWGNSAPVGPSLALDFSGSAVASFTDLEGGVGAVSLGTGSFMPGPSLIDADPLYADPDGPDDDPLTFEDNDYRLGVGSPCADAGDNAAVAPDWADLDGDMDLLEKVPFDLAGAPRFQDDPAVPDTGAGTAPLVDLGAYERP